jgi:hypothetical protein
MTNGERAFQEQLLEQLRRIAASLEKLGSAVYQPDLLPARIKVEQIEARRRG